MESWNGTTFDGQEVLVDTTSGIVIAAILVALIIIVILALLVCMLWIKMKKRRSEVRRARNDAEAAVRADGHVESGLTILRGSSFKRAGNFRTAGSERHTVLPTASRPDTDNRTPSACSSEGSIPDVISPYAVSQRESAVRAFQDQLNALMDDDDYTEIDDDGRVLQPMPYLKPVQSQSSVSDSEQPGDGDLGTGSAGRAHRGNDEAWRDNGMYSELYATLEHHYYEYSPDKELKLFPVKGVAMPPPTTSTSPESPCYESTLLMQLQAMSILQMDCAHVTLLRELGDGHFGKVYLGETVGLSLKDLNIDDTDMETNVSVLVAVKVLKENSPVHTQSAFVKEVKLMSSLSHHNIVNLLGVCTAGVPFMVMEFMIHGDLKHHLQKFTLSHSETNVRKKLINTTMLIKMAAQIADGMQYLASINLVHRDLAARNCLVGANNVVKVADFGMTRTLHNSHGSNTALPIRHTPYECFQGDFSEKSDVWSFCVTVWEIFTLGKRLPYDAFTNTELVQDALKGPKRTLLPQPQDCPEEMHSLMVKCWKHKPEERPSFKQLHGMISDILNKRLDST